jgi:DNA polymerase III delta subunit
MNEQLNRSFCSFHELIANFLSKFDEADLIRTGTLILLLVLILNHLMTDDHSNKKIMKMAALPQVFNILLNQLFCVNTIIDDN